MVTQKEVSDLQNAVRGKKITILGHDNIDVDSVLSSLLLSKFLHFLGIESEFCILEEVKENDTYKAVKNLFDIDLREYQKLGEQSDRNLFLLDHYETTHLGKVVACIDHHPTNKKLEYDFKYVRKSCAAAYMVYEMMKAANYTFLRTDIEMVVAAMLIDTVSFKSSKTIKSEAEIAKELVARYSLDFEILEKYGLSLTPIDEMSDEQIITNGQKWYSYTRKNDVVCSYLQLYGMPSKNVLQRLLKLLSRRRQKTNAEMVVFVIYDLKAEITHEYQITSSTTKFICHFGILSRGNDIMPEIEKRLLNQTEKGEKVNEEK